MIFGSTDGSYSAVPSFESRDVYKETLHINGEHPLTGHVNQASLLSVSVSGKL